MLCYVIFVDIPPPPDLTPPHCPASCLDTEMWTQSTACKHRDTSKTAVSDVTGRLETRDRAQILVDLMSACQEC